MIKSYRENGTPYNQARPGRPPNHSPSDKNFQMEGRKKKEEKNQTGDSVHPSTVRRQLNTMSPNICVAVKKLLERKRKIALEH